jgi:hypothetical protein
VHAIELSRSRKRSRGQRPFSANRGDHSGDVYVEPVCRSRDDAAIDDVVLLMEECSLARRITACERVAAPVS